MDGRSLLSEYPGGEIAIVVQRRSRENDQKISKDNNGLNPFRGS